MKLLVTSALGADERGLDEIRALGHEVIYVQDERGALPEGARDMDGVVCNALFLHHDAADFPNLRFVQLTSAGLDRAPVDELTGRGVAVFNAKGVYSVPLAEWVVMQILQISKRARFFQRNQDARHWEKARDLTDLAGRTACIIGFGDVGREVAKRLRAFDVRIVAVDAIPTDSLLADETVGVDALDQTLPLADFVVLTVPLTPETRHLIDETTIALMRPDAVLVNVPRGGVIDENALVRALEAGKFSGVALDVFEHEPLDGNSPFWGFERVLITPHNSFVSDRTRQRLFRTVLSSCMAMEQGHAGRGELEFGGVNARVSGESCEPHTSWIPEENGAARALRLCEATWPSVPLDESSGRAGRAG